MLTISMDTKLAINSYMINNFSKKGNIGYLYFKLFLEVCYEKYKELGYVPNLKLTELIKLSNLNIASQGCQRALNYFFKAENLEGSLQDILVDITEKIIEQSKLTLISEGDEF